MKLCQKKTKQPIGTLCISTWRNVKGKADVYRFWWLKVLDFHGFKCLEPPKSEVLHEQRKLVRGLSRCFPQRLSIKAWEWKKQRKRLPMPQTDGARRCVRSLALSPIITSRVREITRRLNAKRMRKHWLIEGLNASLKEAGAEGRTRAFIEPQISFGSQTKTRNPPQIWSGAAGVSSIDTFGGLKHIFKRDQAKLQQDNPPKWPVRWWRTGGYIKRKQGAIRARTNKYHPEEDRHERGDRSRGGWLMGKTQKCYFLWAG